MLKLAANMVWRLHWHLSVLVIIVFFLLWLGVVWIAHSATGTRWVLEKIVHSQKMIRFEVEDGTLVDGLHLKNFRFTGKTLYLQADTLNVNVIWAGVLAGQVYIERLRGDNVQLVLTSPPSLKPVKLKHLNLPFRLQLADGELTHAAIIKNGKVLMPIDQLAIQQASWQHTQLDLPQLQLRHPQFATHLMGKLSFEGNYPLQATGDLRAKFWQKQGLPKLQADVSGDLTALNVTLLSGKAFPVVLQASANVIQPDLPYHAFVRWGKLQLPWLAEQAFVSRYGQVLVHGNKHGLAASLRTDLKNKLLPRGEYRAYAETDWHEIHLLPLQARTTLGGVLTARGRINWSKPQQLRWDINSQWAGVDLSKHWRQLSPYLPPLTGQLHSKGQTSPQSSALTLSAQWHTKEQWQGSISSRGRFWHIHEPHTVELAWQQLNRTLSGIGHINSQRGKLHYRGVPNAYHLALDTHTTTAKTPAGRWQVIGQGNRQQMNFSQLDYQGEAGHLSAQGRVGWHHGLNWDAALQLDNFNTSHWLATWPAVLSGTSQSRGEWHKGRRYLHLGQNQLQGELKSQSLAINGDIALELPETAGLPSFTAEQLRLALGNNEIKVEGGFNHQQWNLSTHSQFVDLSQLDARLQGRVAGMVVLQGAKDAPTVTVNLAADNVRWGESISADSLMAIGTLPALGETAGFVRMTAKNLLAANRVIPKLGVMVEGTRADHQLTWQITAEPVVAEGVLHGGLDNQLNWHGEQLTGAINVGNFLWQQNQPFAVNWEQTDKKITLAPHCWVAEPATLCNQEELNASPLAVQGKLSLNGLEISRLAAISPEGLAWQGTLDGNASVNWQQGAKPQLALELVTKNGTVGLTRDDEDPLSLPYHQLSVLANSEEDGNIKLRFDMQAPNMGQGYVEARINPDEKPYQINGAMVLEKINLAIAKPFLPAMSHLSGEMNLAGGLSGLLTSPDFYGEFSLNDGAVTAKNAPINLHHTNIQASIRGKEATINGQLNSGEGQAKLDGKLAWSGDEPALQLKLTGEQLELKQKPLFKAQVSPKLDITVRPYYVDVRGTAKVENALVQPQTLSDNAVALSPDVRVIDLTAKDRLKIAKVMRQWDINADIELLLADDVVFKGFGLVSKLTGSVKLQQQKQRGMQAIGEIQLDKEAKYEAYGQKLQIRRGRVLFAGSIAQPALDVEAVKEVDSKVVGVRVDGRANHPNLTLFSDTAMTQDEMLGYLLLGRPLYQDGRLTIASTSGNDGALLTSAALSLGIKGGRGIASELGNAVGIKDVTLDAEGSGDDTRFTVSGYLSPRLYLRYGVGVFTPVNKVTLRYKLNKSLYLEAVSSLESALDLFYNFKF